MVFSSVPVYLDPPNWHHQQPNQQHQGSGNENPHHLLPPLPPTALTPHVDGGLGSIRPGSMADRARLAKIPQPETPLKCPRCDSTNTKFCYFNNYSLSQPRHFCKACRRYWTRGGALRNVPVGGGCRRNKKNKRTSRSKSPATTADIHTQVIAPSSTGLLSQLPQPSDQLPFAAPLSLHNLTRFGIGNMVGFNLGEIQDQTDHMGFQIHSSGAEQWRLHQFPFLNCFETPSGLVESMDQGQAPSCLVGESPLVGAVSTPSSRVSTTQLPSVKLEAGNQSVLNLMSSKSDNTNNNNGQFWDGGISWINSTTDLASNTHLL